MRKTFIAIATILLLFFPFSKALCFIEPQEIDANLDSLSADSDIKPSDRFFKRIESYFSCLRIYFEWTQEVLAAINEMKYEEGITNLLKEISIEYKNKNYDEAEKKCLVLIERFPDLWVPHFFMANIYSITKKSEQSFIEYEKALQLNPDSAPLINLQTLIYLHKHEFSKARESNKFLLDKYPNLISALYLKGLVNKFDGNYKGAIADFKYLFQVKPDSFYAYIDLADIYLRLGKDKEALQEIEKYPQERDLSMYGKFIKTKILSDFRRNTEILEIYGKLSDEERANVYGRLIGLEAAHINKDYNKTREIFKSFINDYPDNADLYQGIFNTYLREKNFPGASEIAGVIKEKFPESSLHFEVSGNLYLAQENYPEAIRQYTEALRRNSDDPDAYEDLGFVYQQAGNYKDASEVYRDGLIKFPDNYVLHRAAGKAYRELNQYDDSISEYKKAIEIMPDKVNAHVGLGTTYRLKGKLELAIAEYKKAIELNPKYGEPHWQLAEIYSINADYVGALEEAKTALECVPDDIAPYPVLTKAYWQFGRRTEAYGLCEEIAKKAYLTSREYVVLGSCYYNVKLYDKAIVAYQKALEINPNLTFIFGQLASVYNRKRDFQNAIFYAQKAIGQSSSHEFALVQLATAQLGLGQIDKAEENYKKIIEAHINEPELLANYYIQFGRLVHFFAPRNKYAKKESEYYEKAIEIYPSLYEPYLYLADVYRESGLGLGSENEIIRLYNKSIEVKPNENAYYGIAELFISQGKYKEAMPYFDQAITVNPNYYMPYLELARVYTNLGNYQNAIQLCQKVLELNPAFGYAYDYLGFIYGRLGRYEEELKCYYKLIDLEPGYADGYSKIAILYQRKGDFDKTIEFAKKAIKIDPDLGLAFEILGVAYHAKGDTEDALNYFKRAIEINPSSPAQNSLGYFYLTQKNYQKALFHLEEAVKCCKEKDLAISYHNLASAYSGLGKNSEAKEAYRMAIKLYEEYGLHEKAESLTKYVEESFK